MQQTDRPLAFAPYRAVRARERTYFHAQSTRSQWLATGIVSILLVAFSAAILAM